ncbi:MAG: PEP-CTERM sorting domain-containing protein [Deltaproteobacteria bacterium]|nr:PEP-CTERM sorting domain-containing protein [Deltaproteobacteria bacterium]
MVKNCPVLHSFCIYKNTINSVNTDKISKTLHKGGQRKLNWLTGSSSIVGTDSASLTSNSVPEPATMLLLDSGLLAMAVFGRKKSLNSRLSLP